MRFLKRESSASDDGFWTWWASWRDRIAMAIDQQQLEGTLAGVVTRAVKRVHPEMAWELGVGEAAKYALVLSPEGNAEVRPAALRWLASAPPADAIWEYHASRQASPKTPVLDVAGMRIDFGEMRTM